MKEEHHLKCNGFTDSEKNKITRIEVDHEQERLCSCQKDNRKSELSRDN